MKHLEAKSVFAIAQQYPRSIFVVLMHLDLQWQKLKCDNQSEEVNDTDVEASWPLPELKRRRMTYIPLPAVLRGFPDLSPAKLCELADLKAVSPFQGTSHRAYCYGGTTMRFASSPVVDLLAELKSSNRGFCKLLVFPFLFR